MESKTLKQAVKNKKIGPKFALVAKAAGVDEFGCDRAITNLLYMLATKLKKHIGPKCFLLGSTQDAN